MALPGAGPGVANPEVAEQVEVQVKYQGYIDRQREEVARQEHFDDAKLPLDLDYRTVRGLSAEVQQKLNLHRPETLGQASRISGITSAAISLLLVHLRRGFGAQPDDVVLRSGFRSERSVKSLAVSLGQGVEKLGLRLPPGVEARLLDYLALLQKWNRVYNLTAIRDTSEVSKPSPAR